LIFPRVSPELGTAATICVSAQLTTVPYALFPKDTSPLPCDAPKPDPVNVICIPGLTAVGEMLVKVSDWDSPNTDEKTKTSKRVKRQTYADFTNPLDVVIPEICKFSS
jgi:hypothetical protein